jgi:hypothetical protein
MTIARRTVVGICGAAAAWLLASWAPLHAHHSFAAEFDANKPVTLRGTLTSVSFTNPHGWLHVDVKDQTGKVVNWAVEMGGANAMYRQGWKKEDMPIGAEVVVEGFMAKNGSPTINGVSMRLPDGRRLFTAGSAPGASGGDR